MNSRERILAVLNGEKPDRIPFADFIDEPMKPLLMKEFGWNKETFDEADLAKTIGMDAIYFLDYCAPVFGEAHGNNDGTVSEDEVLGDGIIKTEKDLGKMIFPDPKDPSFYDPAKRFIEKYGDSGLALYAGMRPMIMFNTIFSMGMMDFSIALYENRKLIDTIMDKYVEWNSIVIENLQQIGGVDFIMAYNDMAFNSGPLVSPQIFREVFLPKMKEVASVIKLPWAFHSDGDLTTVFDDLLELGMNAINPIDPNIMDINKVKKEYKDKVVLWGNIDLNTLGLGTEEDVVNEVKDRLENIAYDGKMIMASANSIPSWLKTNNVRVMMETLQKHGRFPIEIA